MNGYKIALLAWYAIAALMMIGRIGKPTKPTTPGVAAATMVLFGALAALVVLA